MARTGDGLSPSWYHSVCIIKIFVSSQGSSQAFCPVLIKDKPLPGFINIKYMRRTITYIVPKF